MKHDLLQFSVLKSIEPGETLFSRGDARNGLFAVVDGSIRITGLNEDGKEAILTFIEPPSWIGEVALFDGDNRTHHAIAETAVTVLHIPQEKLDDMLERHPEYWKEFGILLAHKLRLTFQAIEDLSLLPAATRLCRRLVIIAQGYGGISGRHKSGINPQRVISVSQEQLGLMLSISRQTTNQILKELQAKGMIKITYGEIEILDLDQLKHQAQLP
ncbi:Crp/Fnr family transcriptional regulator [Aliikangiella coralliicola]|uniref:Crp/Fnr family transcriptional regulator n=2 Tax=Aliikangiella coralliicola TaxID=2592383 RepID=A0A545U822_9GAMM|nr:Crp/Fnr family transcriptional regulator [Aliikangiella coralliicola]